MQEETMYGFSHNAQTELYNIERNLQILHLKTFFIKL